MHPRLSSHARATSLLHHLPESTWSQSGTKLLLLKAYLNLANQSFSSQPPPVAPGALDLKEPLPTDLMNVVLPEKWGLQLVTSQKRSGKITVVNARPEQKGFAWGLRDGQILVSITFCEVASPSSIPLCSSENVKRKDVPGNNSSLLSYFHFILSSPLFRILSFKVRESDPFTSFQILAESQVRSLRSYQNTNTILLTR